MAPIVVPGNLRHMADTIHQRIEFVLDDLPLGVSFD